MEERLHGIILSMELYFISPINCAHRDRDFRFKQYVWRFVLRRHYQSVDWHVDSPSCLIDNYVQFDLFKYLLLSILNDKIDFSKWTPTPRVI